ncbi:MAG: hypothetical protein IJT12_06945 [Paludibacteraceae bacterium]|nr:hypothetical protein [Paludibacteraceae bacterium]
MKPSRILLCILSTFIVLAAVCALGAGKSETVRVPSLASVLGLPLESSEFSESSESSEVFVPSDTSELSELSEPSVPAQPVHADTTPAKPVPVVLPKALPQTKLSLPLFYAALDKAGKQSVRIVHFGDSQIEEDRISMILRRRLQDRFGGGGIGLVPMVQTIPTYTAKQTLEQNGHEIPYTAIRRYLAYGPSAMRMKDDNRYGPMAQLAYIDQPVDVRVELLRDRVPTYDYDHVRVLCTDSVTVIVDPDSVPVQQPLIALAEPRRNILLHFGGKGYVYGISLETATGVQVDNIPMRGAAGTNFTAMARQPFADYFRQTNTALIIMQFGGNAMPAIRTHAAVEKYIQSMRQQIQFIMSAAPDASLLFIGPSDMITTVEGELQTYPMLPHLDRALAAMVEEEGGAYYSLFRLMGGAGSMISWRDKGLAGEDMIHFTRAGAKKVGEMLAKQLLEDYDSLVESQKSKEESPDTITDQMPQ